MKKHAFITGIAGFAGSFLAEELIEQGYTVSGSILENESLDNLDSIKEQVRLEQLDILDGGSCHAVIEQVKPDYIFHLAAIASVGRSYEQESITFMVNFKGTLNLLGAALAHKKLKKFLFVSSADCYGKIEESISEITESQPLRPISPYGIAKAAAEQSALYYYNQHDLPVVVARSFNHCGPRQQVRFVVPDFAKQIVQIELEKQKPVISVGDLSAERDFSDVRDIVRGYRLMIEKGKLGEVYQLCSGQSVSIQSVLDKLLKFSENNIKIEVDKSRLRKADIPILRGSYKKAAKDIGYEPKYDLNKTLEETVLYWRDVLN